MSWLKGPLNRKFEDMERMFLDLCKWQEISSAKFTLHRAEVKELELRISRLEALPSNKVKPEEGR